MAYELYHTLEIAPTATDEEIKKAYFRLVRKYPPESEPERFQHLRRAYETLRGSKSRKQYDSMEAYGDEIKRLLTESEAAMTAGNWVKAESLLKRMLVLVPTDDMALHSYGICLLEQEKWTDAKRVFKRLCGRSPDVPLYWSNLGWTMFYEADDASRQNEQAGLLQEARGAFQKAIELESYNSSHYIAIARSFLYEAKYAEALAWAERAIKADGNVDLHDIDTLLFIYEVMVAEGSTSQLEGVIKRIKKVVPDDIDAREFVASRCLEHAIELMKQLRYAAAGILLDLAAIYKRSTKVDDLISRNKILKLARQDYRKLKVDTELPRGLIKLAKYVLVTASGGKLEPTSDQFLKDTQRAIHETDPLSIVNGIERILETYGHIYYLNSAIFTSFKDIAAASMKAPVTAASQYAHFATAESSSDNSGCLLMIIGAVIGGAIGGPIGAIIGAIVVHKFSTS